MKVMEFTNEKILPALFDGTKKTTLRKAYDVIIPKGGIVEFPRPIKRFWGIYGDKAGKVFFDKPCAYEWGEVVDVVAKNMTGKVCIDSIIKIEIGYDFSVNSYYISSSNEGLGLPRNATSDDINEMAKDEGFKDSTEMFEFLEKYTEGEIKKQTLPFYLICFNWIELHVATAPAPLKLKTLKDITSLNLEINYEDAQELGREWVNQLKAVTVYPYGQDVPILDHSNPFIKFVDAVKCIQHIFNLEEK